MSGSEGRGRMSYVGVRIPDDNAQKLRIYAVVNRTTIAAILCEALEDWGRKHKVTFPLPMASGRESATDAESDSPAVFVKNAS